MRPADVKRLMDAMAASGVHELELEHRSEEGVCERVRLVRHERPTTVASEASSLSSVVERSGASPEEGKEEAAEAPVARSRLVDIVAPIVGTFYAGAAPDAPNYVAVGDRVQTGTVLCIIEAMKLMNEIEAEVAGTVVEVLVKNEDPVEYGQVLFRIDPS